MTNKEWLATLSEEDFANWIYAERTAIFDPNKMELIIHSPEYSPCLNEVVMAWNDSRSRLIDWLKEERNQNKIY